MWTGWIAFILATCGLLLVSLTKEQSVPETTKNFHPPPIEDMLLAHEGEPITEIGLSPDELTDVISKVLLSPNLKRLHQSPTGLREGLLARHVDLGDGVNNGLVLNGPTELCGASGNCGTWFFHGWHTKWQLVFDGFSGAFAFITPKHHGLSGLVLVVHMNAAEAPTDIWQFNGTRYELVQSYCWYSSGPIVEGKCP
jgi:hypothetical protein